MGQGQEAESQLAELGVLYNLGQSFNAVLDLPELLTQVMNAAIDLTRAEEGLIILSDAETGQLRLEARREAGAQATTTEAQPTEDPLASQVLEQKIPLLVEPDRANHASFHQLYVPLITKGRAIGVLIVRRKPKQGAFSSYEQDMLVGLSGYAAIAIENARLYQQALERTLELGLLVESANAISSSLDLGRVLNAIARHMMRGLEGHWCTISGWDSEREVIYKLAEYRRAFWPIDEGIRENPSEFFWQYYLKDRQGPFAIQLNYDEGTAKDHQWLDKQGCRRILALPMQTRGKLVGVVEVSNLHKGQPFSQTEVSRSLRTVLNLALVMEETLSSQQWQRLALESARSLINATDADWCCIYSWNERRAIARRVLDYGTGVWPEQSGPQMDVHGLPKLDVVLHEQRITTLRYPVPDLHPLEQRLFNRIGPSAMLAMPLVFKGRTVGLVQVFDLNPDRQFSSREIGLAHALASQAAVALENARLVRDLQHSLEEQKNMQSHLVRTARFSALGELAAVVAHQINNPLTTILGDAEMLTQDIPPDHPSHESAQAILRAGRRAKKVVERMLNMSRYEEEIRLLEVNRTIEETVNLVEMQISQHHIHLDIRLASNLPPVQAVPGQLEDVWMNLLLNARDAIKEGNRPDGQIRLESRLSSDGKHIEVSIQDNGIGIHPSHLTRVFEPVFTTKPRGKGTGLGLYICRQIVSDHHGEIRITSTVGEGTCVTVRLPAFSSTLRDTYGPHSDRR